MNYFLLYTKSILNRFILFFSFLFIFQNISFAQVQNGSFIHDGLTRDYLVFLPQNYQPNMPVIFNLHGYTDNAQWQMEYSLMNDVADTAGFIVVYPNAISPGFNTGLIYLNWPPLPTHVDDVGFISDLIDTVITNYNVDKNRIYCCGYSNGGMMTFKLAYHLGHRFAAFGSVAGVLLDPIVANNYSFVRSFPMLLCHGTDDVLVHYNGGPEPMMWSAEETLNFWTQNNNCVLNPDTVAIPDTCLSDSSFVQKISYTNCSDSVQVVFYKVINGGHSWPGSDLSITWPTEGNKNLDINAGIELWNFFKNFTNPYTNIAYGKSIEVNPTYFPPQGDTLHVIGEVHNLHNHQVNVFAEIHGINTTFLDSFQLFDDGLHDDGDPNDNIFGGTKWYSGLAEDIYLANLTTHDLIESSKHLLPFPQRITSAGPVVIDYYAITGDTIIEPGDNKKFQFTLLNTGTSITAPNVTSQIVCLDTFASISVLQTLEYGDIVPGTSATSSRKQYIRFSNSCSNGQQVNLAIDIYSDGFKLWRDTFTLEIVSGLEKNENILPFEFDLKQNYPNPFNPTTNIQFSIPKAEFVTLTIHNLLGQQVATLVSENLKAGSYTYSWNAGSLASGVYLYRIQTDKNSEVRKMILLQ